MMIIPTIMKLRIELTNIICRVSEFGDEVKSRQLLLKPMNPEGAKSVEGTYMCQVKEGENMINRTVEVFIHGKFDNNYAYGF